MKENTKLSKLRAHIDAIDTQMIELLRKRTEYVDQVGQLKAAQKDADRFSFIRSGREAMMLRDLTRRVGDVMPMEAVASIWRMIISTSLSREQDMSVAVFANQDNDHCYWLAREYYGAFLPLHALDDADQVIADVSSSKVSVGVLPLTNASWWRRPEAEHNDVFVFAHIPFIVSSAMPFDPVVAIANVMPEPTGDDISLFSVVGVTQDEWKVLFDDEALTFNVQANADDAVLVEVEGFMTIKDNTYKQLTRAAQAKNIQIRLLGSYARPIVVDM